MKNFTKIVSGGAITALLPLAALAQSPNPAYLDRLVDSLGNLVTNLVPVLVGVAVIVFIWGVIRFITAGEDPEKRAQARNLMIYGIIAIFVIVSIWGLVRILQNLFGATSTSPITPRVP